VAADGLVEYGPTTTYGSSAPNSTLTTNHVQALANLSPGSLYHYRVISTDASSNRTVSPDSTFSTSPAPGPAVLLVGDSRVLPGVSSNPSGSAEAFSYMAAGTGTLNQLSILLDATNGASQVVIGLYENLPNQSPGALLTQGTITNPVAGWNSVSVAPVGVNKNTKYWIAVLGPAGGGTVQFASVYQGAQTQISKETNLTVLPGTWTRGVYAANSPMSAYGSQAP
jgi:hypothetical protein